MNGSVDRVFLHIGSPKTATTSIQRFLFANRLTLLEQRTLVPVSVGPSNNYHLATYATGIDPRSPSPARGDHGVDASPVDIERRLRAEIERHSPTTLIFSNEHLFSRVRNRSHIERLKELIDSLTTSVTVIAYLREPISFLLSHYSTHIKSGGTDTLDQYLEAMLARPNGMVRFGRVLDRWHSVFGRGNLVVRPLDRERLVEQSVVRDFASLTGVAWSDDLTVTLDANPALPSQALELIRLLNERGKADQKQLATLARGEIVRACGENIGAAVSRVELSVEQRASIESELKEDQDHVTETYLGGVALTSPNRITPVEPAAGTSTDFWFDLEMARAQVLRRQHAEHDLLLALSHAAGGRAGEASRCLTRSGRILEAQPLGPHPSMRQMTVQVSLLACHLLEEGSQDAALVEAVADWLLQHDDGALALELLERANALLDRPMVLWARWALALDATGQTAKARLLLRDGIDSGWHLERLKAALNELDSAARGMSRDGQDRTA